VTRCWKTFIWLSLQTQTTDDNDNGHDDHLVDDVLDAAVVVDKDAGRNFTAKLLLLFIAK